MNKKNSGGSPGSTIGSLSPSVNDESSFREVLQLCNSEVKEIHLRMEHAQKEIDQLSVHIEEAMTRLKAA